MMARMETGSLMAVLSVATEASSSACNCCGFASSSGNCSKSGRSRGSGMGSRVGQQQRPSCFGSQAVSPSSGPHAWLPTRGGARRGAQVSSMSAKGRNWGDAVLDNETLQFHADGRPLFNVALPDVVQVCAVLQGDRRTPEPPTAGAPPLGSGVEVAVSAHSRKQMKAGLYSVGADRRPPAGCAPAGARPLEHGCWMCGALQPRPRRRVPAARIVSRGLVCAASGGRMRVHHRAMAAWRRQRTLWRHCAAVGLWVRHRRSSAFQTKRRWSV